MINRSIFIIRTNLSSVVKNWLEECMPQEVSLDDRRWVLLGNSELTQVHILNQDDAMVFKLKWSDIIIN